MIDRPLKDFVDALADRTATPAGGAAAAATATMGAALALMVVRFALSRQQDSEELQDAERTLADHVERLSPMADRDVAAFGHVADAYRLPKQSEEQKSVRNRAIQEAMVGAMVVPDEILCMVRDVMVAVTPVHSEIQKSLATDLATGVELLCAAAEGAWLSVRVNASYLEDRGLALGTLERVDAVRAEIRRCRDAVCDRVEILLR